MNVGNFIRFTQELLSGILLLLIHSLNLNISVLVVVIVIMMTVSSSSFLGREGNKMYRKLRLILGATENYVLGLYTYSKCRRQCQITQNAKLN